jgi:predicted MFS family arabinose efflux permease
VSIGFTATLTVGMVAATFLSSALAVLSSRIVEDLGITRSQLGLLFTAVSIAGAAGAPMAGRIADALGGRRVLSWLFVVVGVTNLALAAAPGYAWALPICAVAGLALAAGNPSTDKLIAGAVGPERRGSVVGLKQSGPPLGVLLAGVALPPIATALGWRAAVAWSSVIPAVGLVAVLLAVPRGQRRAAGVRRAPLSGATKATVWWLTSMALVVSTGVAAVVAFLPLYAQEELAMSPELAGVLASVVGAVSVVGRILWGWHGGRFRALTTPLAAIGFVSVAATIAFWAADGAGPWLLWVGAVGSGLSMMAWHAVGVLGLLTEVEPESIGGASGMVHLGSSVGFAVGPLVFGVLVDRAGSYTPAWFAVAALFALQVALTWSWRGTLARTEAELSPAGPR